MAQRLSPDQTANNDAANKITWFYIDRFRFHVWLEGLLRTSISKAGHTLAYT